MANKKSHNQAQAGYEATYWSRSMPRYWNLRKVLFFLISAAASASCITVYC